MALSSDLVSEFVKVTKDQQEDKKESIVYGTTVLYNNVMYVKLDGSDLLTPMETTVDTKADERVTVMIKNHTATITGNSSSPAARTEDVQNIGSKIDEFGTLMAYKITTEDLEAINATISNLRATVASIGQLSVVEAEIEDLEAKLADVDRLSATDVEAINASIQNLQAKFGDFTDISTEQLEALNADIANLQSYTAEFTYVSADQLTAINARIKDLNANKLSVRDAEIKYANIDFTNIGEAAMEYLYANSGLIRNVSIEDGTITGNLVGVTIKGDIIEGNTVVADKLVIKGTDGLYYKLNTDGSSIETEQNEYNSLNGSIITANSITASKISVSDLVAFDATIGGFNITENSIYSGVKSTVGNTTRGIYMDNDGQISFGDATNFVKFYKNTDGTYKLEISAQSIKFGGNGQTVEEAIEEIKDEMTTNLRIDSSRGTVFKNNSVSTVLSAVIFRGSQRITDISTLRSAMGSSAYLQWKWQRIDDDSFGVISSSDSKISNDGFTLTITPDDVDTKTTFMCELIV